MSWPTGTAVVSVDGQPYLKLPGGAMPLAGVIGTGEQPRIADVQTMQIVCDAGSDIDHAKLLFTVNCTNGIDPDTADTTLASERFNELSSEVYDLNIAGGAAGTIVPISPPGGITMIHFAFAGSGTYTQAAGATVTALQMVLAKWAASLNISTVLLYIGESTIGAGSNQRYRNIALMGFTA